MTCYHPLRGFCIGINPDTGKKIMKIVKPDCDTLIHDLRHDTWDTEYFSNISSKMALSGNYKLYRESVQVGCGQCIGCRLDYSRKWAVRMMLERMYHPRSYFITLTYDEDNLPTVPYPDPDTGEIKDMPTLVKTDIQKFLKRLRKHFDFPMRYYLCGEYGSKSARPHYHLILFMDGDFPLGDLVYLQHEREYNYYVSGTLQKLWPFGHNIVGECTFQSCAYVSRYVTKKRNKDNADVYEQYGIEPEFVTMSRRPGIASQFCDDHIEGHVYLPDGNVAPIPRYFDSRLELFDPDRYEEISDDRREIAELLCDAKKHNLDMNYYDYLLLEEDAKTNESKRLERNLE